MASNERVLCRLLSPFVIALILVATTARRHYLAASPRSVRSDIHRSVADCLLGQVLVYLHFHLENWYLAGK